MLPFGDTYEINWRDRVFRVDHLVELYIPTEIKAAAASSEANSNFPASALIDGDRSHLNAGPFDSTEFGYGPADNLIGKGLWLGKHIVTDPEFLIDNRNGWLGNAYVTSDYFDTVFNWENPLESVGSGPVPGGPVFWWRCGDTHRDVMPRPSRNNAFGDIAVDAGPNAQHGFWWEGDGNGFNPPFGEKRLNHWLGYPGMIVGDDTSSAHLERLNIGPPSVTFAPNNARFEDADPWRTIGPAFTIVMWVRNVTEAGALFSKASKVSVFGAPKDWVGLRFSVDPIGGSPSSIEASFVSDCGVAVSTNDPATGGFGASFNLNDGNAHMIAFSLGKPQGGQPAWEIYFDGILVGKSYGLWPWAQRMWPAGAPAWMEAYPWSQCGIENNHVGEIQEAAIFDYTFMGQEQPDYGPGLVFYNRQKRAYELGAIGTPQPPAPVPPVFIGTTVVGDKLEVDFVGGTSYAAGFDPAYEGEKVELFDAGWVKVPVGDNPFNFRSSTSQMALTQSVTLPPGAGGKSLKVFNKQAAYIEGYGLSSVTYPLAKPQTQASLWEHAVAATASGKMVFDVMIHEQGINPGQGHVMIGAWQGTPTAGLGFKFVMSEATHNFHISITPPPSTDHVYQTHIFPADGVNTGVAWAYDTWYRVAIEFNVTVGLVRLFVDGTFIGQIAGLTLTTGVNKLQVWSKGDDRLPVEAFPGNFAAYVAQSTNYGTVISYIDDIRIGSGCFDTVATYERVFELGGFPVGDGFFSFTAEAITISDPPFTYTPYWSFQTAYALTAGGPYTTPEDVYLNPGKTSSATDVVFDPQGMPYVKIIAKHNADGGECIETAALLSLKLKFGKLAQGLRLQTDGEPVGRLIIYTDPELGGVRTFQVQRSDDLANPFVALSGDEILKVQAFEKYNGETGQISWTSTGEITVMPKAVPGTGMPSVIIVDFKRNYDGDDTPATNWLGLLVLDPGTADDFPRATEIEAYARHDVTDACRSFDVTHQADVNFERIDARVGGVEVRNSYNLDRTLRFTKEMFQKTAGGQTALDMTAEVVISQGIAGEWFQLAWLGVDDPNIAHDSFTLSLACRGRHERLLIEKFPSTFKTGLRVQDVIPYTMALCNVAEGFYAMRDNFEIIPVYAPLRSGWDELSDLNQAQREPGLFFGPKGILRNLRPLVPAVQYTYDDEGFFHTLNEHVSREQAGKPAALHAIDVEVHGMGTAPNTVVFREIAESAQVAERLIQLDLPVDPLTLFNQWTQVKISRAHPRYPKIIDSYVGGVLTGTVKTDVVTTELVPSVAAPTDDPNRIVTQKITNIYVTTNVRAREIALDRLALTERATNWLDGEQPTSPHLELGDIYEYALPTRDIDQVYAIQKVSHTMRAERASATGRVTIEGTETTV